MEELNKRQFDSVQPACQVVLEAVQEAHGNMGDENDYNVVHAVEKLADIAKNEAQANQKAVDHHFIKLSSLSQKNRKSSPENTSEHYNLNRSASCDDQETQINKLISLIDMMNMRSVMLGATLSDERRLPLEQLKTIYFR